jgi:hypothetical protein
MHRAGAAASSALDNGRRRTSEIPVSAKASTLTSTVVAVARKQGLAGCDLVQGVRHIEPAVGL